MVEWPGVAGAENAAVAAGDEDDQSFQDHKRARGAKVRIHDMLRPTTRGLNASLCIHPRPTPAQLRS